MRFNVLALLACIAIAAPAPQDQCPANAPAGTVCCYDNVIGKCHGPGQIYNICE
ncbi:hypothetical protein FOXG_22587 [Fusarium oxysporum f. sp. lycopersici 4287]|uniref:Uncharacterized protein n=1 Tax=Fusarium oxysporum f. sp. lycopersici (strain 4287 / CBS 123668 / FGSC 9935 / NRRL 34936) TaxID=426428 RepID=A0A0J9W8F6_FUSO4|nr:hypothetical protein FOXG_22560 [Fusarium oxysporum f. sp. lycopersici 4287]XP_018257559.1 hypothetical protein FOXG_22587 [Fusarium oxysporum f. sp. lycopersici 4287]KAJ9413199.1 hypothetical protein QL093DRAFT_2123314 [Fusarium oxysporum]KNB19425.1 hypothetical protein FOXG_22560 [Fusarium oxysporum f. sp. lycopersici 4287]KNB19514.1 hypothetical protein FOXG_22587 [Fusarium oxysporum f. sp. lycopersici 4287]